MIVVPNLIALFITYSLYCMHCLFCEGLLLTLSASHPPLVALLILMALLVPLLLTQCELSSSVQVQCEMMSKMVALWKKAKPQATVTMRRKEMV